EHLPEDFFEEPIQGPATTAPGITSATGVSAPCAEARGNVASDPQATLAQTLSIALPGCGASMGELQASAIVMALKQHHGNVSAAARALSVSRNTIYRRLGMRTDKTTPEKPSH